MQRRSLVAGVAVLPVLGLPAAGQDARPAEDGSSPFDGLTVRRLAQSLAGAAYKAPDRGLPDAVAALSHDAYRAIRFDAGQSLWRGSGLPFEAQFFHRGSIYADRVDIAEVFDGRARPVRYRPDMFDFGALPRPAAEDLGFAGFRLHAPLNRADYADEVAAFLGASYFRSLGQGQGYGLSARGLSIRTADPAGEEFPAFRAFWLERPQPGVNAATVHALLDGPSAAAAMRFTIRPGLETVIDAELTLYPRTDIAQGGIATMTSMYLFDPGDRGGVDDYRRAVHDSDGLMMLTGRGEELWRPLANPQALQVSSFSDAGPRGFGLMQRKRELRDFEDLDARYERRPSLWVEPIGDWGEGVVQLIEIPTRDEVHDNVVAFWRPRQPLAAGGEHGFIYRMRWGADAPHRGTLGRFTNSRSGAGTARGQRLFMLDAAGERLRALPADAGVRLAASTDRGRILNAVARPNPEASGWRASFELAPEDNRAAELRATLMQGDAPVSETWVYRWTA